MKKVEIVLLASGFLTAMFALLFFRDFFRRRESLFREDIWTQKRQAAEDDVDQKILLEHRPEAKTKEAPQAAEPATTRPPFPLPNFRGAAHEVLGVPPQADAQTVNLAYKYWIKRYHPDRVTHLGQKYVEQARRRAEQLNAARQVLLRGNK